MDGFALVVGDLDADGGFAGHALDEDGFGAHGEAEVVGEAGDAGVLDAGFGLELVGGDHRAGIDLHDLAADVELGAFFDQDAGLFAEHVFADGERGFAGVEEGAGRQLESGDVLGGDGGGADFGVGAAVDGDGLGGRGWRVLWSPRSRSESWGTRLGLNGCRGCCWGGGWLRGRWSEA